MNEGRKPLSQMLTELCEQPVESMAIGDIVESFGRRAFGALLFVFAVPNLLPLPPGSSTVLGAPLLLLSPQVAIGLRSPWLPRFLARRTVRTADLRRAFSRLLPLLTRVEQLSRPRLLMLFGPVGDRIIGLVGALLAFVLILPIPLGNLAPAFTIGILALALFQRDGIIALIGYACFALSVGLLAVSAGAVLLALERAAHWVGL